MKNKKGQLGNLQSIIVTLIVIGLILGTGFIVLEEFLTFTDNEEVSTLNEEGGYINSTGYTVDDAGVTGFNTFVVTQAVNFTDGTVILVGNYTVNGVTGVITNATPTNYANVSFNYTYLRGEGAFLGVNDTITAMLTIPELLGLIVLIAMIGIILAVIFNVIPGSRVNGA